MARIDTELHEMFLNETKKNITTIQMSLNKLKKNLNDSAAVNSLLVASHGMEGDSLLAKEYLLAYLGVKMNFITIKCMHENKNVITDKVLSEMLVYFDSMKRAYEALLSKG